MSLPAARARWADDLAPALAARARSTLAAMRRRRALEGAGIVACVAAGALLALGSLAGAPAALAGGLLALLAAVGWGWITARRLTPASVCAQLDRSDAQVEDSAALALLAPAGPLNPVETLQRNRIRTRLLARPWTLPTRRRRPTSLAIAATVGLLLAALALWPRGAPPPAPPPPPTVGERAVTAGLIDVRLAVQPPAYTGLDAFALDDGDARVPAGSRVRWSLAADAGRVTLRFHDGSELALQRDGRRWVGDREVDAPLLVRVLLDGEVADAVRWRIDVVPDGAPTIEAVAPPRTLNEADADTREWPLEFAVRDDYGLGDASLVLTHTQGTGEQIAVREQRIPLAGDGDARARRYLHRVTLADIGYAEGDDLIARLEVTDNRDPQPNVAISAGYILRWAPEPFVPGDVDLEGVVRDTLPAYFRSQRQIIIDSEALIAERTALSETRFLDRADRIANDQKLLRLRYGQFMGEEAEAGGLGGHDDHAHGAGGGHDAHQDGHDDAHGDHAEHDAEAEATGHAGDDAAAPAFGAATDVLQSFGHTHDHREAATLFDPETRAILRRAIDAMWRAEEQLRIGRPEAALPHEHAALDAVKQVQQASRIYLARVGADLPEIDPARRLTGEREPLDDRADPLPPAEPARPAVVAAWQALDRGDVPDRAALLGWLDAEADAVADPLSLRAALEETLADPGCAPCRQRLRDQLWPLLPLPAAGVVPRSPDDLDGDAP